MMDALKKELADALTDEDYVASITDVLCRNLLKSLKKAAKEELEELGRTILRNKGKIVVGGIAIAMIVKMIRKGK